MVAIKGVFICEIRNPIAYVDVKGDKVEYCASPFVSEIGEEKWGTYLVPGTFIRLRIPLTPALRGGSRLRKVVKTVDKKRGETSDILPEGRACGQDYGNVWNRCSFDFYRSGGILRRGRRDKDHVESRILIRDEIVGGYVDARRVLKVDVDIPTSLYSYREMFEKRTSMLRKLGYQIEDARLEFSSSGEHVHYVIVLKEPLANAKEVYDLQVLLGDDQKRATFNYVRYKAIGDNSLHFNVLFKRKMKITRWQKIKLYLSKIV